MGNCMHCFQTSAEISETPIAASMPTCQKSHIEETDELLSARSPLKNAINCDTKRNSFKKTLALLNGNAATMSDIITTAVKQTLEVSDTTLNKLFDVYKDPEEDMILTDGIERLCQDLKYQPDEFAILVLAWCLDASQMCRFTKAEFIEGLHKMCADSIEAIRIRLEQTIEMLKVDTEMFKQLYRFTFRFGLEPDQRILSLDMAISLWKLVFTVHKPELLDSWIYFLEQHPSIRGIPKDTWNMFMNFSEQCDIINYDDTEAWPSLFDDFVDNERSKLKENEEKEEEMTLSAPAPDDDYGATALITESSSTSDETALMLEKQCAAAAVAVAAAAAAVEYADDDNNNDNCSEHQVHQQHDGMQQHATHQSQKGKSPGTTTTTSTLTEATKTSAMRSSNDDSKL